MIKYEVVQKGVCNYDSVFNFISDVDEFFPKPLSERVNLKEFSEKIFNKSIIIKATLNGEIIAMSSFYANDLINLKAYLTFLAVGRDYRKKGIADKLLMYMFSILKEKKMMTVELTTETKNISARKLYEKKGFKLVEKKIDRVRYAYYLEGEEQLK